MKKLIALVAVAAVVLSAPAAVGAGNRAKYKGAFEVTGTMSFVLKEARTGRKVVRYSWEAFPLRCEGKLAPTSSGFLEFSQQVNRGNFRAEAVDDQTNPGARLSLRGELVGRGRAEGTLRIRGDRVPVDGPGRGDCTSGTVRWTAEKV